MIQFLISMFFGMGIGLLVGFIFGSIRNRILGE